MYHPIQLPQVPKRPNRIFSIDIDDGEPAARPSPMGLEPVVVIQMDHLHGSPVPSPPVHVPSCRHIRPTPLSYFREQQRLRRSRSRSNRRRRGPDGVQRPPPSRSLPLDQLEWKPADFVIPVAVQTQHAKPAAHGMVRATAVQLAWQQQLRNEMESVEMGARVHKDSPRARLDAIFRRNGHIDMLHEQLARAITDLVRLDPEQLDGRIENESAVDAVPADSPSPPIGPS